MGDSLDADFEVASVGSAAEDLEQEPTAPNVSGDSSAGRKGQKRARPESRSNDPKKKQKPPKKQSGALKGDSSVEQAEGGDGGGGDEEAELDPAKREKLEKKRAKLQALKARKREHRKAEEAPSASSLDAPSNDVSGKAEPKGQPKSRAEQAAYLSSRLSVLLEGEMTQLEKEKTMVEEEHMSARASKKCWKTADAEAVCDLIRVAVPDLGKLASQKELRVAGSPLVLVISASAVRANELAKALRRRLPQLKTAKLFAKHFKVEEQVEVLKTFQALAVGTPQRLSKLSVELGAISLSNARLVVLDTLKDQKSMTLLTLPDVAKDTAKFLRECVVPELENGELKLAFF